MKIINIRPFILIILFVTSSCIDKHRSEKLFVAAERLMESRPDSALKLMASVSAMADSLAKPQRMRCELLKAKAQNKQFIPFTTDSTMRAVTEWYDRHGSPHERMTAHYLLGCAYRDINDAPSALNQYNMAVSLVDTTAADCDWHTLSRIHGQMGMIFHKMASPEYELREWETTYSTAMKANDTIMAFNAYAMKAQAYNNMYKEDSVISITNKVVDMYERLGHKDIAAGHLPVIIYVYLRQNKYDKAKKYIDYYEQYSGFFDTMGNIEPGKESYYGTKAEYYNGIGQTDSAYIYLKKLIKFKDNIQCAEVAYRELMTYYEKQKQVDSIIKYARLYCQMNDSSAIVRSAEEVNRTQALFNYNNAQQIAMDKTAETDTYRIIIILIAITAIFIIIVAYMAHTIKIRKQRAGYTEINKKYNDLLIKYNSSVKDIRMIMSDFEQYKTAKKTEVEELRKSISDYHDSYIDDITDNERALRYSELAEKLHSLAAKGKAAVEQELTAANVLTRKTLPNFYETINSQKYELKEIEINVCVLIRLNFIPSEIAVLLGISSQRVTNIRSNINKKLFKAEGAKKLDLSLKRLR